jgi:hypothetical protein
LRAQAREFVYKNDQACKGDPAMSQSLAKNTVHLVFSTKDRRMFLRDKEREELHSFITGILRNRNSPLIEINSVPDRWGTALQALPR